MRQTITQSGINSTRSVAIVGEELKRSPPPFCFPSQTQALKEVDDDEIYCNSDCDCDKDEANGKRALERQVASEKEKGNEAFRRQKFETAEHHFTRAIEIDSHNAVLHANRAMALLKQRRFDEAERDCTSAIELNSTYVKAFHRRGVARAALRRYRQACDDFRTALKLEPGNAASAKELRAALQQLVMKAGSDRVEPLEEFPAALKSPAALRDVSIKVIDDNSASECAPSTQLVTSKPTVNERRVQESDENNSVAKSVCVDMEKCATSTAEVKEVQKQTLRQQVKENFPLRAPLSVFEFESTLKRLTSALPAADYLALSDANLYEKFGVRFNHAHLTAVCRGARALVESERHVVAWHHLEAISKLERIGSLALALESGDRADLRTVLNEITRRASCASLADTETLRTVAAKLRVEI